MHKKRIMAACLALILLATGLGGCAAEEEQGGGEETGQTETVEKVPATETFRDKDTLYENQGNTSVKVMYLTVRTGNSEENSNHTWEEVNSYSVYDYDDMGVARYKVEGILQEGDENGPTADGFGYGLDTPNATVQIRGQTSSRREQKNYKIEIKKNKGTIDGQRTISLNKHVSEGLRFRNKLCYDLMSEIPQLMSLRTQFVHLYVKDETASGTAGAFEDYGLYTQVEQLNKTALKAHGLDSNGHLYKVEYFEFFRYEDVIKLQTDPTYDDDLFFDYLECKGDNDNTKLIQMLEDLNNYQIPIEDILETYFDQENIVYWMAFHMLNGNIDTNTRNLYIYSPQNSTHWYLISWDNDASFMKDENTLEDYTDGGSWQSGVSNYWGNVLFNRCLKSETFCTALDAAVEDVKGYMDPKHMTELITGYRTVTERYAFALPDITYESLTPAEYDQVADGLPALVDTYYNLYRESLEKPMPFYIGVPTVEGDTMHYNWDSSYDFDAEDITYSFELSTDYNFTNKLVEATDLRTTEITSDTLEPGQYFMRVRATNTSGEQQDAFDYYVTDAGKVYGVKCFYVLPDGSIGEDVYEE